MKHAISALTLCAAALASPAWGDSCPAAPDHSAAMDQLLLEAQSAPDEAGARQISRQIARLWVDAPDAHAQQLLDTGIDMRHNVDWPGAITVLNALVAYCPDYAEGYNQRAFVNFMRGDYGAALPDLERALELSPHHLGAMTGQAFTLLAMERNDEAATVLRAAIALNPWLPERAMLATIEAE